MSKSPYASKSALWPTVRINLRLSTQMDTQWVRAWVWSICTYAHTGVKLKHAYLRLHIWAHRRGWALKNVPQEARHVSGCTHSSDGKRKIYRQSVDMHDWLFHTPAGERHQCSDWSYKRRVCGSIIDADQCRYGRQHLLHMCTAIISTSTEVFVGFFCLFFTVIFTVS